MHTRLVVGFMSGTSIDALDAALVEIRGDGLASAARLLAAASYALGAVGDELRRLANQERFSAAEIAGLSRRFTDLHGELARDLLAGRCADLIAVHGQTVYHAPPVSWQLFSPAALARATAAAVVCDLRAADMAAGGQGAPITPLADWILFRAPCERRVIVNLGGFANFTALPADAGDPAAALDAIAGGDICVCNQLLDRLARERLNAAFDPDGAAAASGRSDAAARAALQDALQAQAAAGRSLGTGDELPAWFDAHAARLAPADALRTACDAIGGAIAARLPACERVLLAGGGARNRQLRAAIAAAAPAPLELTDAHGVPLEQREAICMAVLGALSQDGVAITLPQITGCRRPAPVAGVWAGAGALRGAPQTGSAANA